MRKYFSLEDCLYRAFADFKYCNPQDSAIMWAILEGMERLKTIDRSWRRVDSRQMHECIRGCKISSGVIYFHWDLGGGGWDDKGKVCDRCMAMILYFKDVHLLRRLFYTHWDIQNHKPVDLRQEGIEEIDSEE